MPFYFWNANVIMKCNSVPKHQGAQHTQPTILLADLLKRSKGGQSRTTFLHHSILELEACTQDLWVDRLVGSLSKTFSPRSTRHTSTGKVNSDIAARWRCWRADQLGHLGHSKYQWYVKEQSDDSKRNWHVVRYNESNSTQKCCVSVC